MYHSPEHYRESIAKVDIFAIRPKLKLQNFNSFYSSCKSIWPTVPFNKRWWSARDNDFSPLVSEVIEGFNPGDIKLTKDNFGRHLVIIGTNCGNVVVYQGYSGHTDAVCVTGPKEFHALFGRLVNGWMSLDVQAVILGYDGRDNVGVSMQNVISADWKR